MGTFTFSSRLVVLDLKKNQQALRFRGIPEEPRIELSDYCLRRQTPTAISGNADFLVAWFEIF